jgi:hypothetical protein
VCTDKRRNEIGQQLRLLLGRASLKENQCLQKSFHCFAWRDSNMSLVSHYSASRWKTSGRQKGEANVKKAVETSLYIESFPVKVLR